MEKKSLLLVFIIFLFTLIKLGAQEKIVPPPPPPSLSFDDAEEEKYLNKLNAETQAKLEQIKKINKDKYRYLLRDAFFRGFGKDSFFKEFNKKYYERQQKISELNISTEALAAEYLMADKSKKNKIRAKLKTELSQLFDLREAERKEELTRLEKEMKELKKSLKVRTEKKNQILERRIQDLLNEDDYLDWD